TKKPQLQKKLDKQAEECLSQSGSASQSSITYFLGNQTSYAFLGSSLSSGDFSGDSSSELLLFSAPSYTSASSSIQQGAVFIVPAPPSNFSGHLSIDLLSPSSSAQMLSSPRPS